MLQFGQALYLWRSHRGLTQAELARRARIPRPNLSSIERGRRDVSLRTLRTLALALDVTPGTLVDGVLPDHAGGAPPVLSRERMERIANAVAFNRAVPDPNEHATVEALRMLLGHRARAARGRPGGPRTGRRKVLAAWVWLKSVYDRAAIQALADRVLERQRA